MDRRLRWGALVLAFALFAAACSGGGGSAGDPGGDDAGGAVAADDSGDGGQAAGDSGDTADSGDAAGDGSVDTPAPEDLTFHVITEANGGTWWPLLQQGAQDAADELGVTLVWMPAGDGTGVLSAEELGTRIQENLDAAVADGSDGIAVSLYGADPSAYRSRLQEAAGGGVPVVAVHRGTDPGGWADYGLVGQVTGGEPGDNVDQGIGRVADEQGAARSGLMAGEYLCVQMDTDPDRVDDLCERLAAVKFAGPNGVEKFDVGTVTLATDASPEEQDAVITESLDDVNRFAILGTSPDATMIALRAVAGYHPDPNWFENVPIEFVSYGTSPEVLGAIADGEVAFAIDERPYAQGYLAVQSLALKARNASTFATDTGLDVRAEVITSANVADIADGAVFAPASGGSLAMITEGDGSHSWSVLQRGAEDAAAGLGVDLQWMANGDSATYIPPDQLGAAMLRDADAAAGSGVDGIAISLGPSWSDQPGWQSSLSAIADGGTPIVAVHGGAGNSADALNGYGLFNQVVPSARFADAERLVGAALASHGAHKVLCVTDLSGRAATVSFNCQPLAQEINDFRDDGTVATITPFDGEVIQYQWVPGAPHLPENPTYDPENGAMLDELGNPVFDDEGNPLITEDAFELRAILEADPDIDSVVGSTPEAALWAASLMRERGMTPVVATPGLTAEVLAAIADGDVAFAIDDQPYAQGYLAVLATQFRRAGVDLAGPSGIVTGLQVIDRDAAAAMAAWFDAGLR